jgi:hypothetical protein
MTRRQRTQLVEVRADLILGAEFTFKERFHPDLTGRACLS